MKAINHIITVIIFQCLFLVAWSKDSDTVQQKIAKPVEKDSLSMPKKICSCQLMKVQVNNYQTETVGIFAEKTAEGKLPNNYRLMNELIRREAIYFRIVFTKSAGLKEEIKSETDCLSLFQKLKSEMGQLRMYNILDVDILAGLAKR